MGKSIQKLVIVSHVVHYCFENRLFAYGPYAREIDLWGDLFPYVQIVAPVRYGRPPGDSVAFSGNNISILRVIETGGDSFRAKLAQLVCLPSIVSGLCRAMRSADAIHV